MPTVRVSPRCYSMHGARLDLRDDLLKSTPLGWACRWGRMKLVETLIARGAPIDEPDAEPWARPKAWARKMGQEAILVALARLTSNSCFLARFRRKGVTK